MPSRAGYAPVSTQDADATAAELYTDPPPPPNWEELELPERDAEDGSSSGDEQQQGPPSPALPHGDPDADDRRAQLVDEAPPQYQLYELEDMPLRELRQLCDQSGIDAAAFDALLDAARPDRPKRQIALKLAEANSRLPTNWHRVRWLPTAQLYYWDAESNAVQLEHPAAQYRRRTGLQMLTQTRSTAGAGEGGPAAASVTGGGGGAVAVPPVVLNEQGEAVLSTLCSLGCAVFGIWVLWRFVAWVLGGT